MCTLLLVTVYSQSGSPDQDPINYVRVAHMVWSVIPIAQFNVGNIPSGDVRLWAPAVLVWVLAVITLWVG